MRRTVMWYTMLVAVMAILSCGGYPAVEAAAGNLELPEAPEPEAEKKPGTSFTPYLFELSGDREYYPGLFLGGQDFSTEEALAKKTIIDFRDNYLRLGLRESPAKKRSFDYGTYRLTISFPDTREKRLITRIPYFDMAVRVLAQGVTVFANGDVGTTRETTQPRLYYPVLVELPVVTDQLEIVLHVANFEYPDGGIRDTLVLGDLASMASYNETQTYLEALIMGSLLLMTLANLVLLIFLPDKKRPLYLMLMCLATLSLMLVNGASMMQTMDEFRDFIAPTRQPDVFAVTDAIEGTLDLLQDMLSVNRITVETDLDEGLHIVADMRYRYDSSKIVRELVELVVPAASATPIEVQLPPSSALRSIL